MLIKVCCLSIDKIMNTSWFAMLIISLYTAQNIIHLEYNFNLFIPNKISTETVASMVVTDCYEYVTRYQNQ
jgi:hypothetical protein